MEKKWTRIAALSMAVAVTLGALGAHVLKEVLAPASLMSFETGIRYQIIHSLALLILAMNTADLANKSLILKLMFWGMCLFSGSIYFLSTRSLWDMGEHLSFLGPVTPFGGVLMIASWILLAIRFESHTLNKA